ncbi:hypothetical protein Tco_1138531 [Tanacetum coccineum]
MFVHGYTDDEYKDVENNVTLICRLDFLMGLDDTYMQIRSSILSRDTFPDVRSAYAIISSEESHRVVAAGSSSRTSQRSQTSNFVSNVSNRGNFQWNQTSDSGANQDMAYTNTELVDVFDTSHLNIKVGHPNGTEPFISDELETASQTLSGGVRIIREMASRISRRRQNVADLKKP